jgi:hypothetical protein
MAVFISHNFNTNCTTDRTYSWTDIRETTASNPEKVILASKKRIRSEVDMDDFREDFRETIHGLKLGSFERPFIKQSWDQRPVPNLMYTYT